MDQINIDMYTVVPMYGENFFRYLYKNVMGPKGNVINPEVISLFLLDDKNRDSYSHGVFSSTFPKPVHVNLESESISVPA